MNTPLDTTGQLGTPHQDAAPREHRTIAHGAGSTVRPPRRRTPMTRTITVLTATITLLVGFMGAAQAGGGGFVAGSHQEGLFYGDLEGGILLFAGATPQEFCAGDEPIFSTREFSRRDDTIDVMVDAARAPIYLYASDLPAPVLVAATCAGEASPEPFAEGEGLIRMRRVEDLLGAPKFAVNSTVGTASSDDGTTWRVRGWADLEFGDDGPIGDPADFQGLRVTMTGR